MFDIDILYARSILFSLFLTFIETLNKKMPKYHDDICYLCLSLSWWFPRHIWCASSGTWYPPQWAAAWHNMTPWLILPHCGSGCGSWLILVMIGLIIQHFTCPSSPASLSPVYFTQSRYINTYMYYVATIEGAEIFLVPGWTLNYNI